jgi:predicted DNA-binding antitoxin AbrB/MazE fold protein
MIQEIAMKGVKLMPRVIEAIYEGGVLKPTQPLDISEHTRVRITIEPQDEPRKKAEHILALARQSCEGYELTRLPAPPYKGGLT